MLIDILMESLLAMDDDALSCVLESCDAEELDIISGALEITAISAAENKYLKEIQSLPKTIDKTDPRRKDPKYMKTIQNNADYAKLHRLQHYISSCTGMRGAGKLTKSSGKRQERAWREYVKTKKRLLKNDPQFKYLDDEHRQFYDDDVATYIATNDLMAGGRITSPKEYDKLAVEPLYTGYFKNNRYSKELKSIVRPIEFFNGEEY